MKKSISIARKVSILLTGAALVFSTACSSSQQDEEELEVSNEQNQQGNLGEDDAAEGNGQENAENEFENEQGEQGADVNSETGNEFENENQQVAENTGENIDPTLDNTGGGNQAINTSAPMNPAAMAAPVAAPAAAPATSERSPVPGGRVRYVKSSVQVVNAPGGSPVFQLETGDHPVTWEENGWLRLSTGMYVPVDSMSDKGVARPNQGKGWN